MTKILCVDNDRYLTDLLRYAFEREGFSVTVAYTGHDATRLAREERPHVVTLDLDTIDGATMMVLPALRTLSRVPIVALSTRTRDEDVIAGFEGGADDYVTKPFNMEILVTRVKAVLRRASLVTPLKSRERAEAATFRIQGAVFDVAFNRIVDDAMSINLTPTQSRILHMLCMHRGQAMSTEHIMTHLWDEGRRRNAGAVRTHIKSLREKIGRLPGHPQPIRTLPGYGYLVRQLDDD